MKIAASLVLIMLFGFGSYQLFFSDQLDSSVREIVEHNTTHQFIKLPDGSNALLNEGSTLKYPDSFSGQASREVSLIGEGFFDIKHDPTKPFVVHTGKLSTTVLGTSFNVRSVNGATEVIVETGVVQVTRNGVTVELRAGEQTSLVNADTSLQKQETEDKLYNYYVSKTFVCDNTPLWKLVEKLNEAYDARIRIEKASLRKLPLTVTFDQESLDTILDVISQTLVIKVSKKDNEIILR